MAEHGTTARYVKHKRDKEQACIICKAAWREWQAARRKKVGHDSTRIRGR